MQLPEQDSSPKEEALPGMNGYLLKRMVSTVTCMDICMKCLAAKHAAKPGVQCSNKRLLRVSRAHALDGCKVCERDAMQPVHCQQTAAKHRCSSIPGPQAMNGSASDMTCDLGLVRICRAHALDGCKVSERDDTRCSGIWH